MQSAGPIGSRTSSEAAALVGGRRKLAWVVLALLVGVAAAALALLGARRPDALEELRSRTRTSTARLEVLDHLQGDVRWQELEQRRALCDAYLRSVLAAGGAVPLDHRAWTVGLDADGVVPALSEPLPDPRVAALHDDLLRDDRWSQGDQRGPLCRALIELERSAFPDVG